MGDWAGDRVGHVEAVFQGREPWRHESVGATHTGIADKRLARHSQLPAGHLVRTAENVQPVLTSLPLLAKRATESAPPSYGP